MLLVVALFILSIKLTTFYQTIIQRITRVGFSWFCFERLNYFLHLFKENGRSCASLYKQMYQVPMLSFVRAFGSALTLFVVVESQ